MKRKRKTFFFFQTTDYSNRDFDDEQTQPKSSGDRQIFSSRNSQLKKQKENDHYFRDVDRLSQTHDNDRRRSQNSYKLSTRQNETIDNLVQKLEDHIATELDR